MALTGGCQCGAVRYAISGALGNSGICHCRMCQKAMGGAYLASVNVVRSAFAWTRGTPARWDSSSIASRLFCANCGTPLVFLYHDGSEFSVALGTLDDPDAAPPVSEMGAESRRAWWRGETITRSETPTEAPGETVRGATSHQHPDHDTAEWAARPRA